MATTNDPVSDLLTRVRNAIKAQHRYVDVNGSLLNTAILRVFKDEGFIENFLSKEEGKKSIIRVYLKYAEGRRPIIQGLKRVSRPGLRRYVNRFQIPRVCGGLGISVVSTSKGVMAGETAKRSQIGGELLCYVW
ncbi:MAG: 30S ribosomal protein S8 [Parachlamydiales bacterium]|nr:30S ribosomal protein S8 [Parachlamydiales bacterium]